MSSPGGACRDPAGRATSWAATSSAPSAAITRSRTPGSPIAALYEVRMTRLSPVGLVVSWPEAMT